MAASGDQKTGRAHTLWERADPRPAPVPLSRDRIVSAAIAIADAEGLGAVSLRKVGAALEAGPMRLYGYVDTKDDLLDLMIDSVYAEMTAAGPVAKGWRPALRDIAGRLRGAAHRHEWFADLLGGRPHQGPGALAFFESALCAVTGEAGFEDIDLAMEALRTVNAYVVGAVRGEAGERRAERDSGLDKAAWQVANSGYLSRMIATGGFPTLDRVMRDHVHPEPGAIFDRGLECLLDGLAARLAAAAP